MSAGDGISIVEEGGARTVLARASGPDLDEAFARLRGLTTREAVAPHGLSQGMRVEDLAWLEVSVPAGEETDRALRWLARQLPREVALRALGPDDGGGAVLRGAFRERHGGAPTRVAYTPDAGGRIRVEAFELHVVEHCNLRCAHCCNMSPLVPERTLTVDAVARQLDAMAQVIHADVFKIMGGEPLLHPDVPGVLRAVKASGIGDVVRLFSNGLLLHTMPEAFWAELDQLTLSSYRSAPIKPAAIALAKQKSKEHGFILNVKPVDAFSVVLSPRYEPEDAKVQQTYEGCWLRHRCLIARNGRFFKCTRAAYAPDFHAHVARDAPPEGYTVLDDGIPIDGAELAVRLADYMNASRPLASCRYCLGGGGPLRPHHQLTRDEVRQGLMSSPRLAPGPEVP